MQALKILKSTERAMYIGLNVKCPELEDVDDPHVTLLYGYFIPNSDVEDTVVRVQNAIKSIKDIIPSKIHLNKIDKFPATENSGGNEVIYAAVSSKEIITAHDKLLESLRQNGVKVRTTFPEYKPHVTLEYKEDTEDFEPRSIDVVAETTDITIGIEDEDGDTEDNAFHISKMDDDQRLVFGWAQVANRTDGKTIIDHQGDIVDPEELEKGAYEYVLNFRDGGEEHISGLRKKAKLVESCVFTEEKQKAIGIPSGYVPEGWWIGFHVHDDEAWNKIKSGHYQMFSIEGKAVREPVAVPNNVAKSFDDIFKFNDNHAKDGKFCTGSGGGGGVATPSESNGGSGTKSSEFRETLWNVESDSLFESNEVATVYDGNGKQLFQKSGNKISVEFTDEEADKMRGGTLTHNHPNNSFLSDEDITMAMNYNIEIRACTEQGIYSFKPGEMSNSLIFNNRYKKFNESVKDEVKSKYVEKIKNSELSESEAQSHYVKELASRRSQFFKEQQKYFKYEYNETDWNSFEDLW